jgi:Amt family ammonium transporter
VGALLTGVFAAKAWNGTADGLLHGNPGQLGVQALAVLATIVYSTVASFILLKAIGLVFALKANRREEGLGLDVSQHGEEAYADDEGAVLILPREEAAAPAEAPALGAAAVEGGRS